MAPIPETEIIVPIDSDEEDSLLLLPAVDTESKCYSSIEHCRNDRDHGVILFSSNNCNHCESRSLWLRFVDKYLEGLETWPLTVKTITAFFLMCLADSFAQLVEHLRGISKGAGLDALRMLRFGVFGLLGAPWTHYYYDWLDRTLPPTPQPWTMTTAVKVVIDQAIQAPLLLALIISGLAFMECRGWDGIKEDMGNQYIFSLFQNWKLWIPATIVNIAFVKPSLRVLYDNVIFLVWTIYLSTILNGKR